MRADPRCPSCDGKVSATAEWCMHCGRDFDAPVDKNATGAGTSTVTETVDAALGGDPSSQTGSATGTDASDGSREPADPVGDLLDDVSERDPNSSARSVGSDSSAEGLLRAAVGTVVDYLGADEDRRQGLAVAVAFLAWLLVSSPTSSDPVALIGAVGLGLYLSTRATAQETLAASAYGTGALLAAVPVVSVATGTAPSVGDAVASVTWSAVVGGLLVSLGAWIRSREF